MNTERYEVWVGNDCYAKEMRLQTALILVKGLFEEWWKEESLKISIRRMTDCKAEVYE